MVASSVVEDPLGLATSFKADTLAIIEVVVMADKLAITEVGEEEEVVSLDKLALVLAL